MATRTLWNILLIFFFLFISFDGAFAQPLLKRWDCCFSLPAMQCETHPGFSSQEMQVSSDAAGECWCGVGVPIPIPALAFFQEIKNGEQPAMEGECNLICCCSSTKLKEKQPEHHEKKIAGKKYDKKYKSCSCPFMGCAHAHTEFTDSYRATICCIGPTIATGLDEDSPVLTPDREGGCGWEIFGLKCLTSAVSKTVKWFCCDHECGQP
jgi:hypothetical protein